MDDRQIVSLFLERSEQAIEAVSQKYGKLCRQIALGILPGEADAEECVNDAYLALWNSIPPEEPESLRAYLTRLVRNLAYDRCDYHGAQMRDSRLTCALQELQEILPNGEDPEQLLEGSLIRQTLNTFLHTLSKKDRYLFLRRYYYLDTCRQIARETGMTESAVSTRLGRLRRMLKALLRKEGIFV